MVTETPTLTQFAMFRLANFARKKAERANANKQGVRINVVLNAIIRVVLHIAGFGLLTFAGFQWNMITGLVVAGVSCFALSTLLTGNTIDETEVRRAPDMRTGR